MLLRLVELIVLVGVGVRVVRARGYRVAASAEKVTLGGVLVDRAMYRLEKGLVLARLRPIFTACVHLL